MSGLYVASNPTALSSQFQLMRNMGALGETLTKLSTGLKLNSGKDDPAGLIASELMKAQLTGTNKAIVNTQRANALFATADAALGQIGNLLNDIKGLTVEAAQTGTMTEDQIAANQLQVDLALDSIDRIARSTNYGGRKILDGTLDFRTAGMSGGISNVRVNTANFGNASSVGVNVDVQEAADYARLISNGTGTGVATTFDVIGSLGSATVSIGANRSNADIAEAINRSSDSTGVIAYVEGMAARGSTVLSSAGANNDILITANTEGFDAGNYSFRITRGDTNDARVVSEAVAGQPGIIEISLVEGQEARYNDFAGLFNIVIDTSGTDGETAVTMTQGTANQVIYNASDKLASSNVVGARSMSASAVGTTNSALNGWTVAVDNSIATAADEWRVDTNNKTVYVASNSTESDIGAALANAMAKTDPGATVGMPQVSVHFNHGSDNAFVNGDRFTFTGGASAGEVYVTYKEGATANDILTMLNNAPNVTASLASGVNGNTMIKNLPDGRTSVSGAEVVTSRYSSGASAQDVIDLINSKLGHLFTATNLAADGTSSGRVSYMDAAVDYGDVNMGNALRFTGMDNGPVIRMTTMNTNGSPAADQKLSVNIIQPTADDIKAGIHTPILEIKLATDRQGNSITTAQDIVNLFKTLTPEQTMGVSVAQLYPPGVDPNGRIFGTDGCDRPFVVETCPSPINGIVQPTGAPGVCGPQQGDLILLGTNQHIATDNAIARVSGHNRPTATTGPVTTTGTNPPATTHTLTNGDSVGSILNAANQVVISNADATALKGLTVRMVDAGGAGSADGHAVFNSTDGVLELHFDAMTSATVAAVNAAINGALSGTGAPGSNVLNDMNAWRTSNGLKAIEAGTTLDTPILHEATGAAGTPVAFEAGNQFTFGPVAQTAPALTFSEADAAKLGGVTFLFSGEAMNTSTFDAASKTITLGLGVTTFADDATFKAAVDGALNTLVGANGLASLGYSSTDTLTTMAVAQNDLVVSATTAGASNATSSAATMPLSINTSNAVSAAVQGASPALNSAAAGSTKDFTFNGVTFTISTNAGVSAAPDVTFTGATGGSTTGAEWTTQQLAVTMDDDFLAGGFADADAFATALAGLLNGAGHATDPATDGLEGLTGFTVSIKNDPGASGSAWTAIGAGGVTTVTTAQIATAIGTAAFSDPVTAGEGATNAGTTILTFDSTSAVNGLTFGFTREEHKEGFDSTYGTLMIYLGPEFNDTSIPAAQSQDMLRSAVNSAVAANWEAIRSFTGATGDAVRLAEVQDASFTAQNATHDATNSDRPGAAAADGKTMISASNVESNLITGNRGVATDDPVLTIKAKEAGTHMAGITIHFVNDTNSGLQQWNNSYSAAYGATDVLPDLKVEFDGKALTITGNLGSGSASEMNAGLLAKALNANSVFASKFSADAMQFGAGTANGAGVAGSVLFNSGTTVPQATTVGGYKIESGNRGINTSSGIGMTGQSDSNERLIIESQELGSNATVQIRVINGSLNLVDSYGNNSTQSFGHDMTATVNGLRASTQGNHLSINTPDLSVSMNVANSVGNYGFSITGGGALLQLGPDVVTQQQMRVGIGSMLTTELGGKDGLLYMLRSGEVAALTSDDAGRKLADKIVMQAISDVSNIRGRLGAVQRGSLEPNLLALQDSVVALTDASAMISNADFAVESSNLARLQLLIQAGANTLGIANQLPQYAAMLVR